MNSEQSVSLAAFMDYVTHLDGPEEFKAELKDHVCMTPLGTIDMELLGADPCLADPQMSQWRNAFVWRIVEMFDDAAVVVAKQREPVDQEQRRELKRALAECNHRLRCD